MINGTERITYLQCKIHIFSMFSELLFLFCSVCVLCLGAVFFIRCSFIWIYIFVESVCGGCQQLLHHSHFFSSPTLICSTRINAYASRDISFPSQYFPVPTPSAFLRPWPFRLFLRYCLHNSSIRPRLKSCPMAAHTLYFSSPFRCERDMAPIWNTLRLF